MNHEKKDQFLIQESEKKTLHTCFHDPRNRLHSDPWTSKGTRHWTTDSGMNLMITYEPRRIWRATTIMLNLWCWRTPRESSQGEAHRESSQGELTEGELTEENSQGSSQRENPHGELIWTNRVMRDYPSWLHQTTSLILNVRYIKRCAIVADKKKKNWQSSL